MIYRTSVRRERRAIAALELALVSPLLIFLLFGVWELGRYIEIQQVVQNAAREGCRCSSTGKKTSAEAQLAVYRYLNNAGFTVTDSTEAPLSGVSVVVRNVTQDPAAGSPPAAPTVVVIDSLQNEELSVTVTIPLGNFQLISKYFVPQNATMTVVADWNSMVDKPLTFSSTIPTVPQ